MAGEIDREMSSEQTLARWNANSLLELRGAAEPGRERDEVGFLAAAGKHSERGAGSREKTKKKKQRRLGRGRRKALGYTPDVHFS